MDLTTNTTDKNERMEIVTLDDFYSGEKQAINLKTEEDVKAFTAAVAKYAKEHSGKRLPKAPGFIGLRSKWRRFGEDFCFTSKNTFGPKRMYDRDGVNVYSMEQVVGLGAQANEQVEAEGETFVISSLEDLKALDAKLFEQGSDTMAAIGEAVKNLWIAQAEEQDDPSLWVEQTKLERVGEYRKIVDDKRAELERIKAEELRRRKAASLVKAKESLAEDVKYKYAPHKNHGEHIEQRFNNNLENLI